MIRSRRSRGHDGAIIRWLLGIGFDRCTSLHYRVVGQHFIGAGRVQRGQIGDVVVTAIEPQHDGAATAMRIIRPPQPVRTAGALVRSTRKPPDAAPSGMPR